MKNKCCIYIFFKEKIRSNIFFESIVGILSISLFFALLSYVSPSCYRFLTKWANQPLLQIQKECYIKAIEYPEAKVTANVPLVVIVFIAQVKPVGSVSPTDVTVPLLFV